MILLALLYVILILREPLVKWFLTEEGLTAPPFGHWFYARSIPASSYNGESLVSEGE